MWNLMDPAQGLPDLFPQLRRGADLPGASVGQRGDPIRERQRHRHHAASGGADREGSSMPTGHRQSWLTRFVLPVGRHARTLV
jgi:hypothetical protein